MPELLKMAGALFVVRVEPEMVIFFRCNVDASVNSFNACRDRCRSHSLCLRQRAYRHFLAYHNIFCFANGQTSEDRNYPLTRQRSMIPLTGIERHIADAKAIAVKRAIEGDSSSGKGYEFTRDHHRRGICLRARFGSCDVGDCRRLVHWSYRRINHVWWIIVPPVITTLCTKSVGVPIWATVAFPVIASRIISCPMPVKFIRVMLPPLLLTVKLVPEPNAIVPVVPRSK